MPSCRAKALIAFEVFNSIIWGLLSTIICQMTLDYSVTGVFIWNYVANEVLDLDREDLRLKNEQIQDSKLVSHGIFSLVFFGIVVGCLIYYLKIFEKIKQEFQEVRQRKLENSLLVAAQEMTRERPLTTITDEKDPLYETFVEFSRDHRHYGAQSVEWRLACEAHWAEERKYWNEKLAQAEQKAKEEVLQHESRDKLANEVRKLRLFGMKRFRRSFKKPSKRKRQ